MERKIIDKGIGFLMLAEILLVPLGISIAASLHANSGGIFVAIAFLLVLSAAGVGAVLTIIGLAVPRSRNTKEVPR